MVNGCGRSLRFHNMLTLPVLADVSKGVTLWMKVSLDLRRLVGGMAGQRMSLIISWRWRSSMRLISGGAIPASVYRFAVGVGLRQPVIRREVEFRAGSIFLA